jgi:hypothetical protein
VEAPLLEVAEDVFDTVELEQAVEAVHLRLDSVLARMITVFRHVSAAVEGCTQVPSQQTRVHVPTRTARA